MEKTRPLILIAGPSGCGKTTLVTNLQRLYGLEPVVSYTTRPMRTGEKDGIDHHFISAEAFEQLLDIKAITMFNGHQYCVTGDLLSQSDTYVVDPAGILSLKNNDMDRPIVVLGILASPSLCRERMLVRGDSEEKITERLRHDAAAFAKLPALANVMLDGSLPSDALVEQAWMMIQFYKSRI